MNHSSSLDSREKTLTSDPLIHSVSVSSSETTSSRLNGKKKNKMCIYDRLPRVPSKEVLKDHDVRRTAKGSHTSTVSTTTDHHPEDEDVALLSPASNSKDHSSPHSRRLSMTTLMILAMMTSASVTLFSLYFPFWLAPQAAAKTYHLAFYQYNQEELHHFDTTAWTYGTDYFLAAVMVGWCLLLYKQQHKSTTTTAASNGCTRRFCQHIWGLLLGYAASTTAGALAHQHYASRETRNTWHFRLLWTICVGTVTYASAPMGAIASEMARQFQPHMTTQHGNSAVPLPFSLPSQLLHVPEVFWKVFGIVTTAVCACGWFSYQRPACDIFIAGITQFPSSFYMMWGLFQIGQDPACAAYVHPTTQWMGILAFIANAPLLPLYPLLVQYTDWSLATVNTFLHTWLLLTWSLQAVSLTNVQKAMAALQQCPPKAVPLVVMAQQHNSAATTKTTTKLKES